jgi:hypothetical protein
MLIQQITGTVCVQFVERAFGLGAAEPRTIGGSFEFRPVSRCALLELFQIDQITHASPHYGASLVITTMQSMDVRVRIPAE